MRAPRAYLLCAIGRLAASALRRRAARLSRAAGGPVGLDEAQHSLPCVCGCFGEVFLLAVEEAVRSSFVRDELVLDAGGLQRLFERRIVVGGDVLVGARLEGEDRRLHPVGELRGPGRAVAARARPSVEADGAAEPVPAGRGEPRVAAAEAE